MVVFVYSLSARSGLAIDHLYKNFLLYYRRKLKERPPVQPEEVKIECLDNPLDNSKSEYKSEPGLSLEERKSEIGMIDMSQVLSKASIRSGEMSHSGDIPRVFPGLQDKVTPNENQEVTVEDQYKKDFQEILNMTRNFTKTSKTYRCYLCLVLTAVIYIIYNLEYQREAKKKIYTRIGIVQTSYLIYFDFLIICWNKSYLANSNTSIAKSCTLMLLYRLLLASKLRYWVLIHCIIYVILVSIIGTSLCNF
jgi:hypothetical protein